MTLFSPCQELNRLGFKSFTTMMDLLCNKINGHVKFATIKFSGILIDF